MNIEELLVMLVYVLFAIIPTFLVMYRNKERKPPKYTTPLGKNEIEFDGWRYSIPTQKENIGWINK